ncbi:MAG TPA: hypothetical protein DCS17_02400 [Flavobacterium sp.]|nr:hypothetical protein [Flavobacterium sp.]
MAFDLKTFEIYNQFYLSLKNEFYIPKFEYGLTNAFVYPNRVFADYKIGIIEEYFNNSFNTFYSFTNELTNKIDKNFDINFLLNSILEDTDLKFGLFGTTFVKRIEMKMQQNNE